MMKSRPLKQANMAHHCCVPMCKNDARYDHDKILSFHSFPKDEKLRKEWTSKIKRDEGPLFRIRKHTKVCSAHFRPDDFKRTLTGRRDLRKGAIPCIFRWTTKSKDSQNNNKSSHSLKSLNRQLDREEGVFLEACVDHSYEPANGFREEFEAALSLIKFSKLEFC
ncbi:THAP domain-containing protein 2 isoform X1 [Octopus bimaculoides]|nr:THAP domain-containing protein 2 isoform X1 [Octopus bimaculoides]|eukprot:XP_014781727.1 PREDICTED: THAP domain-containing protein 2-like [Octopus bimaculoides]